MSEEEKTKLRLEIAHVLFIDIVGYSKLLIDEQMESQEELNGLVRSTDAVREAQAANELILLPTGDGMALVFTRSVETPVECALQISQALRAKPSLPLRMGIHSGPVQQVMDVNQRANFAGVGINVAQRVMDCGDEGHILISKRVADDLAAYRRWQPYLHELGDFEVKHGATVSLFNLYADVIGNPKTPAKFQGKLNRGGGAGAGAGETVRPSSWKWVAFGGPVALAAVVMVAIFWPHPTPIPAVAPPSAAPSSVGKSVAVLPFENLSADKENAFFTDGVQDEILADLAKVADLKVISRTSVRQYTSGAPRNVREIATQLGVAHVVEGSVQREGTKVRVTAQLIDARTDAHEWAEHYDRNLSDVFAIQSEIAQAIAFQLQARISPRETTAIVAPPTTNLAAYDLYLRAANLYGDAWSSVRSADEMPQADHTLDEALAQDPKFLLALCLKARVNCWIYWLGLDHTASRLEKVRRTVQRALELQPDAGEAHLANADYYYHGFRDYDRARAELDLARKTLPNSAEVFAYNSYIDRRQGKWEECVSNMDRALELDPRNYQLLTQIVLTYEYLWRYPDMIKTLNRVLAVVPDDPDVRLQLAQEPVDERADVKALEEIVQRPIAETSLFQRQVEEPAYLLCLHSRAAADRSLASFRAEGEAEVGAMVPHAYWEGVVARWEKGPSEGPRGLYGRPRSRGPCRGVPTETGRRGESAGGDRCRFGAKGSSGSGGPACVCVVAHEPGRFRRTGDCHPPRPNLCLDREQAGGDRRDHRS